MWWLPTCGYYLLSDGTTLEWSYGCFVIVRCAIADKAKTVASEGTFVMCMFKSMSPLLTWFHTLWICIYTNAWISMCQFVSTGDSLVSPIKLLYFCGFTLMLKNFKQNYHHTRLQHSSEPSWRLRKACTMTTMGKFFCWGAQRTLFAADRCILRQPL